MKYRFRVYALLISLVVPSLVQAAPDSKAASNTVNPGGYCHETPVQAVVLEELSLSLALVTKSEKAIIDDDFAGAYEAVSNATTALELASSRGAAARTAKLIDTVLDVKASEDNKQILDWFPMLHTAILHIPENAYSREANNAIARSEEILNGDSEGDAMDQLRSARHWLSCDRLDFPLDDARQALGDLSKSLYQHKKPGSKMFEAFYSPLRQAIQFMLAEDES